MGISYVIPAAVCDLNLTASDKGLLTGMTFFGKIFFARLQSVILCSMNLRPKRVEST